MYCTVQLRAGATGMFTMTVHKPVYHRAISCGSLIDYSLDRPHLMLVKMCFAVSNDYTLEDGR